MSIDSQLVAEISNLIRQAQFDKAKKSLESILAVLPENAWANYAMGTIWLFENNLNAAKNCLSTAIASENDYVPAYNNLAVVYIRQKAPFYVVEEVYRKILDIQPDHFGTLLNFGKYCMAMDRQAEIQEIFGRMENLMPESDGEYGEYLSCIFTLGYHLTLINHIKKFKDRFKNNGDAIHDLGLGIFPLFAAMRYYGYWDDSNRILKNVMDVMQDEWQSLQLFSFMEVNLCALAIPQINNQQLFMMHKLAGKAAERDLKRAPYSEYPNAMRSAKRWRIGVFSPDYRKHVVDRFLRGLVTEANKRYFEIYCYSNTKNKDDITDIYAASADVFVDVTSLTDVELAERIYADGIHLLLHATLYTQNSRLEFMLYKPAPIQIVYLGYPYTSGVQAADYFISDPYLDGPQNAQYFVEQQLRLPEGFASIGELPDYQVANHPPCMVNGHINFGTLINIYKINEQIISLWARVMKAVPGSTMTINRSYCQFDVVRENLLQEFAKHDIGEDRLRFIWQPHLQGSHLCYYNDIDIMLDTFPLTGGTTTFDALFMGVPVVTLVGELCHQRISYGALKVSGVPADDLIAFSEEEFFEKAVALAQNVNRIDYFRKALPEGLKGSVLCDPVRLTRHMEAAYLEAWDRKFPVRPVNMDISGSQRIHLLQDGIRLVTEDSLEDTFNYVFQEQGRWHEAEWLFLQRIVTSGMVVLDIGAEAGHYAIPLAKRSGSSGKLWLTTHYPQELAHIQESLKLNPEIKATIIGEGDRKLRLNYASVNHHISNVDILRIHAHDAQTRLFKEGDLFFQENNPLIMFGLTKCANGSYDLSFAEALKTRGYDLFRLMPGLNVLVPFTHLSELDVYALNLFACKPERAQALSETGYLAESIPNQIQLPGIECVDWQSYLREQAYASSHVAGWSSISTSKPASWEAYWSALNLYARAQGAGQPPSLKVAYMQGALNLLLQLAQQEMRFSRVVTLIRVLTDLGKREEAVQLLTHVCGTIDSGGEIVMDEPFMSASDHVPACDTLSQLGRAVFADLLYQREKLRMFSTYFTGAESLMVLSAIEAAGLGNDDMRLRALLIQQRQNEQVV